MKKTLHQEIEIPEGVEVKLDGAELVVKGKEGELKRKFEKGKLNFEIKEGKIVIGHKKATKNEKKIMNTIVAHIRNMIKGVEEGFEYKLKVCFSHFPINVKIEGNKAVIKNFLGEKIERSVDIPEGAEVKVEKDIITIKAINKEVAGQAAANFERATKIRMKDRRVFQDGFFIINKAGREI